MGDLVGATAQVSRQVTSDITARAVGSGDLDVFATPILIALMEQASCAAVDGQLPAGSTSVGIHVDARHHAPSAVGTTVTAQATVVEADARRITYDISAWQDVDGERVVATGRHTRVVVDRATFGS